MLVSLIIGLLTEFNTAKIADATYPCTAEFSCNNLIHVIMAYALIQQHGQQLE